MWIRRQVVPVLAVLALVACSGDDAANGSTPPDATRAPVTSPVTTPAAPTSPTTVAPTTVAPPPATTDPAGTDPAGTDPAAPDGGRYPTQPPDVAWPTETWAEADLPGGIDRDALDRVVDEAFVADDATASMRSVVVVHGGAVVYERYHPLASPDTVFDSFSVAKSVTAALAGMAVDDGLVELDRPTGLAEWADDERASITLEHLLWMASGLEWEESYAPGDDPLEMLSSPVAAAVPIAKPLEDEPGTVFNYSTGTTVVVNELIARALGGPDELDRYVRERLIEPLGMRSVEMMTDDTGLFLGGLGFDATTRDFARFGLLFLRGGEWDGQRLLDETWVDRVRAPSPANDGYGLHWWLHADQDAFSAQGLFGQRVTVVPDLDLVVAVNTAPGGDAGPVVDEVIRQFRAAA